jgi:hypothetical protein
VSWGFAFVGTLLLELPLYTLLLRRRLGTTRAVAVAAAINLATHPLAWLAISAQVLPFIAVETCVWLTETLLIYVAGRALARAVPFHEALLAALAANALSAGVGLLL